MQVARRRAAVGGVRRGAQEAKVLEKDVHQATMSEKRALAAEQRMRNDDLNARAVAEAAMKAEGAMQTKLQSLKSQTLHEEKQMTHVQEKEAEMVLSQKEMAGRLAAKLAEAGKEEAKLKRESALERLALQRLHNAFEEGKAQVKQSSRAQGGSGGASQLQWYVPWTSSLASAGKNSQ